MRRQDAEEVARIRMLRNVVSDKPSKVLSSETIEAQVEKFLAKGGKIEVVPQGMSGLKEFNYIDPQTNRVAEMLGSANYGKRI